MKATKKEIESIEDSKSPAAKQLSSVEVIMSKIMGEIQQGKLVSEQRLVTTDVARKLGTSQAPVREALSRLAGEGLLDSIPNVGFRVRSLTYQNLLEGVVILQVVGALAIRLASDRFETPEYSEQVKDTVDEILLAGEQRDAERFFTAISATHRMMNDLAGNSYLTPILNRIHLEYFNSQLIRLLPGNWERYIENYRQMGECYQSGDAKKLEKLFVKHLSWVMSLLKEKIDV